MTDQPTVRRPGGRTARVRADVHRAVEDLARTQPLSELTLAQVAERSGVHLGTLYRRWKTLDGLLLDVVNEHLSAPMPDTGSLREDLERHVRRAAEDVAGPVGKMLLHTLVAIRLESDGGGTDRLPPALVKRFDDLRAVLDRAAARGENPPSVQEVFEIVLAPLYASLLFGTGPSGPDAVGPLIDRLMCLTGTT
ncbi:TetR-like C-terminal domain-containing protein [Streptomyces sp. Ru72]|uniref:TetR-like C-terminal domain-containing protein n=1 Tax=Streptomyces sp. Ru72 TaxID=2080747 RepID=UPI000CDE3D23|nr:TetR-like C-terminal domain-containing protein [Streptomyces sp. Ru72]POX51556.1 TetR/AcrR family transcriptional regulator [Streptomyces sp. Ru72]